jgi:hypothetical protein
VVRDIRTRAREDLATFARGRDRKPDDLLTFFMRKGGGFAGCPDRNDSGNAGRDLCFD